jgi:hypothetical protein
VDYSSELVKKIVRVISQANKKAKPVRLKAGVAEQQNLSFNRRFHMKNGTVRFNPGVMNPDIVRVAGPIDPELGIVFFNKTGSSNPDAVLVNFTLHLDTVGGSKYAADYPFYIEESLRQEYGDDFISLFGTGTCGGFSGESCRAFTCGTERNRACTSSKFWAG